MSSFVRLLGALALACFSAFSLAQRTITVTSPIANDYLGKSNNVKFSISGAQFEVLLKVKVTFQGDTSRFVNFENRYTPDANNKINDNIAVNFSEAAPQGKWLLEVTPIEKDTNGNQFSYTPSTVSLIVNVDVKAPAFENYNPQNSAYVKGQVRISAFLNELNVDTWKVTINGSDIPNNSGSANTVDVPWDTSTIQKNGVQNILIRVDDKAKNSSSKAISVTLDRTAPNGQIVLPNPGTPLPPNTNIVVQVNVTDQFADSLDVTGIDVVAKTMDNKFITRVARRATAVNGNTLSWSGRIRWTNRIPNKFKIVATSVDKAGNAGAKQEITVQVGKR